GGGHVPGQDQQAVREAKRPERGDAPLEVVAEEEPLVRLIDDDVAEALDLGGGLKAFPADRHLRRAQVAPAHNAFNARVRRRQVEEPLILVRQLASLATATQPSKPAPLNRGSRSPGKKVPFKAPSSSVTQTCSRGL